MRMRMRMRMRMMRMMMMRMRHHVPGGGYFPQYLSRKRADNCERCYSGLFFPFFLRIAHRRNQTPFPYWTPRSSNRFYTPRRKFDLEPDGTRCRASKSFFYPPKKNEDFEEDFKSTSSAQVCPFQAGWGISSVSVISSATHALCQYRTSHTTRVGRYRCMLSQYRASRTTRVGRYHRTLSQYRASHTTRVGWYSSPTLGGDSDLLSVGDILCARRQKRQACRHKWAQCEQKW
eukprot:1620064-Rhodomonas_salina.1